MGDRAEEGWMTLFRGILDLRGSRRSSFLTPSVSSHWPKTCKRLTGVSLSDITLWPIRAQH